MLDQTITLTTDVGAGDVSKVFDRYTVETDRSEYKEQDATLIAKDAVGFYRTQPKRSGTFLGTAKCQMKFTKSFSILDSEGNTTSAPLILNIQCSVPVGITPADTKLMRFYASELLKSATAEALMDNLEI